MEISPQTKSIAVVLIAALVLLGILLLVDQMKNGDTSSNVSQETESILVSIDNDRQTESPSFFDVFEKTRVPLVGAENITKALEELQEDTTKTDLFTITIQDESISISLPKLNTEQQEIKRYGNTVGQVVVNSFQNNVLHAEALGKLIDNLSDEVGRQNLAALALQFKNAKGELTTITPYETAESYQGNLKDQYELLEQATLDILQSAEGGNNDAFVASLISYNDEVISLLTSLTQFANYFGSQGITFSSNEPGYIFALE